MSDLKSCVYLPGGKNGGVRCNTRLNDCKTCIFKLQKRYVKEERRIEKSLNSYANLCSFLVIIPTAFLAFIFLVLPAVIGIQWTDGMEYLFNNFEIEIIIYTFFILPLLIIISNHINNYVFKLYEIDRFKKDILYYKYQNALDRYILRYAFISLALLVMYIFIFG